MNDIDLVDIAANAMTFRARIGGPVDGEPVVLLHGFPQSSLEWDAQLPALVEAGYRVVAPDQRGYSPGARPDGAQHYALDQLVGDVTAIAGELGHDTFHLVGHDWGGFVAWAYAWRHPERVRSLTAVSVPHPAAFALAYEKDDEQRTKSFYLDWFRIEGEPEQALLSDDGAALRGVFQGAVPEAIVDEYVRHHLEPGAFTAALNWYRAMLPAFVGTLGPISTPTLYVWGDQDVALGRVAADATGDHVVGPYRYVVLEGIGHWIPEQAADTLNELLLEHLSASGGS